MEQSFYEDFYLYAKGHYVRSDDPTNDLKQIVSAYTGHPVDDISVDDVISVLTMAVEESICKCYNSNPKILTRGIIDARHDNHTLELVYNVKPKTADEFLIDVYLRVLGQCKVLDANGPLINLGRPDSSVLPIKYKE